MNVGDESYEVAFDQNVLTVQGLTHDQAVTAVRAMSESLGATPAPAKKKYDLAETGRTSSAKPNQANVRKPAPAPEPEPELSEEEIEGLEALAENTPNAVEAAGYRGAAQAARRGPPMPRVDTGAIAQAAAITKPKEAPVKPKAAPKAKAAPPPPPSEAQVEEEELEENEHGVQMPKGHMARVRAAHGPLEGEEVEEEETDIPFPEEQPKAKAKAANGKATTNGVNGHAKAASSSRSSVDVPDELKAAKKLKDVLNWIIDQGISDKEEIKAKCAELRPHVPVLQRISDIDSRVERTLEVMEAGEDAT
jgi:hypothetical protein